MRRYFVFWLIAVATALAAGPAVAATGGPDAFGYTWDDSEAYVWNDISGTGTLITGGDEVVSAPIDLGFTFDFYGTGFTAIQVTSNGTVTFNGTVSYGVGCDWSTIALSMFAGKWSDLNSTSIGAMYYAVTGTAPNRKFIVQYHGVPAYGADTNLTTFQIVLEETTNDIVVYINDPLAAANEAVGLDADTTTYLLYKCGTDQFAASSAVRFIHPEDFWSLSPRTDDKLASSGGELVTYTLSIYNNTGSKATFDLAYDSEWEIDGPASVVVADGTTEDFDVTVTVPASALCGLFDVAGVTATLATETRQSTLTTSLVGDCTLFSFSAENGSGTNLCLGVEWIDPFFYVTCAGNGQVPPHRVHKFDAAGTWVSAFDQSAGASAVSWGYRDMCYDGQYLYASYSTVVEAFDLDGNFITASNINGPQNPNRGLAYDPDTDHFWTANFASSIYEFARNGTIVNTFANTLSIYGLAWDDVTDGGPFLWAYVQDDNNIHQFDPVGGVYTGVVIPGFVSGMGDMAGGLSFTAIWDVKGAAAPVLIGLDQSTPDTVFGIGLGTEAADDDTVDDDTVDDDTVDDDTVDDDTVDDDTVDDDTVDDDTVDDDTVDDDTVDDDTVDDDTVDDDTVDDDTVDDDTVDDDTVDDDTADDDTVDDDATNDDASDDDATDDDLADDDDDNDSGEAGGGGCSGC